MKGNASRREQVSIKRFVENNMDVNVDHIYRMNYSYTNSLYTFSTKDEDGNVEHFKLDRDATFKIHEYGMKLNTVYRQIQKDASRIISVDEFYQNLDQYKEKYILIK